MKRVIASSKRSEAAQRQRERVLVDLWEDIAGGLNEPLPHPEVVERVESCLRRVFAALPARDRAVMKFYYLEGLNIHAIGVIYRRHRSQVARWLAGYRERISDALRDEVRLELGALGESELGSRLRRMQDELDVTIGTLLASTHSEPEPPVG